jgi:hypothetical protein
LLARDLSEVARRIEDDPQARLVHQRIEQWDTAIRQSIEEVPVPPGLAERILERLRAARPDEAAGASGGLLSRSVSVALQSDASSGETQLAPPSTARGWSRRHWVGAAAAALVAGVLVIAVGNWLRPASEVELPVLADQWRERLGDDWQQIARAPENFAVPPSLLVAPQRWQWIDQFTTVPVAAYELVHAKAGRAMLYVARMSRAGLPSAPPVSPQSNTGGRAVAWWQTGDRVYVLVVDDERSYRAFVRPSAVPLA